MTFAGTLARYITWRFVLAIVGVLALCMALIYVVDFIELMRRSGKYGSVPMGVLLWIALLRLPSFSEIVLPFAVLLGSIGAFLLLSRNSELVVVRAAGMSVWQFVLPGVLVAVMIGVAASLLYNPLAAAAKQESERLYLEAFGRQESVFSAKGAGSWLRQDGIDGPSVMHARLVAEHGVALSRVTLLQFGRDGELSERVEAASARLRDGRWELGEAWVSAVGQRPAYYDSYIVSTYLTPTQVRDSLGSVESISFWELQNFIEIAERAGLPALRHKLQYQTLLTRPMLLAVMVLVAATCSLRAFRFGRVQTLMIAGVGAGFAFFVLAEVSRNLGLSGHAGPALAAWAPTAIAGCLAATVLLYQEDG